MSERAILPVSDVEAVLDVYCATWPNAADTDLVDRESGDDLLTFGVLRAALHHLHIAAAKSVTKEASSTAIERVYEAISRRDCETEGLEDMEPGCCAPCRARTTFAALTAANVSTKHPLERMVEMDEEEGLPDITCEEAAEIVNEIRAATISDQAKLAEAFKAGWKAFVRTCGMTEDEVPHSWMKEELAAFIASTSAKETGDDQ